IGQAGGYQLNHGMLCPQPPALISNIREATLPRLFFHETRAISEGEPA
ncbi:uncharacterized protein METZ01_LOCUS477012, partial [marine metagenome]